MKKLLSFVILVVVVWMAVPKGAFASINQTLSGIVPIQHQSTANDASYILQSFKVTGATPSGYVIHNWSQVNQSFESMDKLTQMVNEFAQPLEIGGGKLYTHQDVSENYCRLLGTGPDGASASVTLASLNSTDGQGSTILTIHEEFYGQKTEQLGEDVNRIQKMLATYAIEPQISACIQGTVSARMSDVHKLRLITKALSVVGAHRIEGVESDLVDSISAYSPLAPSFIVTNGRKMNLQVAVHYDSYHQRTNVLVGTPIITVTY